MEIRKANKIVHLIPIWGDQRSKPAMQTLEIFKLLNLKKKKKSQKKKVLALL